MTELVKANCVPSNKAANNVTPQLYTRDLAITAVLCFTGGVGLTLLAVLIYYQVSRKKKLKERSRQKEREEGGLAVANHDVNHRDGNGKKRDLLMPANSSQKWDGEVAMFDPRTETHSDQFRFRAGEVGSHFRCPDCNAEGPRGAGLNLIRRDNRMEAEAEEERERRRARMMMIEEERRRLGNRQPFLQQGILTRDAAVTGKKPLLQSSSHYYSPSQRETVTQSGLRPEFLSAYKTSREMDNDRIDMEGQSRDGHEILSCEGCHRTYEYRPIQKFQSSMRDSAPFNGYSSQYRQNDRYRNVNYSQFDLERNGGYRRETRNVTFDLESSGILEGGTKDDRRKQEARTSRDKETGGEGGSGKHKGKVHSSRLLKVKLNLNPLRRSKVHPKKKTEHSEKSGSKREKQGSKEKRQGGKGKGDKAGSGSSSQENKQSSEKVKKSTKSKATAEKEEEEGEEGGQESKKKPTSKTEQGGPGSAEGGQHNNTPPENSQHALNDAASTTDQSDAARAAGSSAIGQQAGPPANGQAQITQGPSAQYYGAGFPLQNAQPAFSLSAADRNRTTNFSLLGLASSQLTGSSLSLQGGNMFSNMAPSANAIVSSNLANTIAPSVAYAGLSALNVNAASSGDPGNLSRQTGYNSSVTSLLANSTQQCTTVQSSAAHTSLHTSQLGALSSSLVANPAIDPTPIQSQLPADSTTLVARVRPDLARGPGPQSGEEVHQLASQPPALQAKEVLSVPTQAQGGGDASSAPAPGPVTENNQSNIGHNSQTQPGCAGGVSVSAGSAAGVTASLSAGGVATADGSAGVVSGGQMHPAEVSVSGVPAPSASAAAPLLQQEYLSEEGGSSSKRKLRLVLPEKTSSRPPTALERKIR